MRNLPAVILGSILAAAAWGEDPANNESSKARIVSPLPAHYWKTRPVRRDTPLREDNITDLEIAEVEAELTSLYPGAVVYVSAVTTGCPCEDGPECTDLVWSVASLGDRSRGVALSRIDGAWRIGPLQTWWLEHDAIWAAFRASRRGDSNADRISYDEHMERLEEHKARFPRCVERSMKDVVVNEGTDAG